MMYDIRLKSLVLRTKSYRPKSKIYERRTNRASFGTIDKSGKD